MPATETATQAAKRSRQQHAAMELGKSPAHYTTASTCKRCGPVWLWQGAPTEVLGCPWCHHAAPPAEARPGYTQPKQDRVDKLRRALHHSDRSQR